MSKLCNLGIFGMESEACARFKAKRLKQLSHLCFYFWCVLENVTLFCFPGLWFSLFSPIAYLLFANLAHCKQFRSNRFYLLVSLMWWMLIAIFVFHNSVFIFCDQVFKKSLLGVVEILSKGLSVARYCVCCKLLFFFGYLTCTFKITTNCLLIGLCFYVSWNCSYTQ